MNSKKTFILLVVILFALIIATGGLVYAGINMLTSNGETLVSLKLEHEVLADKQKALVRAKQDIVKYADLEKIAKKIVPQEKDQAITVKEISDIAKESGAPVTSIEFPKIATTPSKTSNSTSKSTSTTSATDKNQLTAVKSIPGLYEMEITIICEMQQPTATYEQIYNFIKGLEHNRRTANITSVQITPYKENNKLANYSLTLKVYIKP